MNKMDKILKHNKLLVLNIYHINQIKKTSMLLMNIHIYKNKYRFSNISETTSNRY